MPLLHLQSYLQHSKLQRVVILFALKQKKAGKAVRKGDIIEYVLCLSKMSSAPEACDISELKQNPDLIVDHMWYIEHQILPPILRLCQPIDYIDEYKIKEIFS